MHWLIVEDSLESRNGHWFDYLAGFCYELPKLGDSVELLVSHRAETFILDQLKALPILPESVYQMKSGRDSQFSRYVRIPLHGFHTLCAIAKHLRNSKLPDVIFVPTVNVHHLIGWVLLVKCGLISAKSRLLLFFPSLPIQTNNSHAAIDGSPTSKLIRWLIALLSKEIGAGRVLLGVETQAMRKAAEAAFGSPFIYFPHPVEPSECHALDDSMSGIPVLTMACYGSARHEKGSELLVEGIEKYLLRFHEIPICFVIQWIDGFRMPSGAVSKFPNTLKENSRVKLINRCFEEGEYAKQLASTHVLLLPYRRSSYNLRLSRIVIEALINGIPVMVTEGTTLAEQAQEYGVPILCKDEDIDSITKAIDEIINNYDSVALESRKKMPAARRHFSVANFRNIIFSPSRSYES